MKLGVVILVLLLLKLTLTLLLFLSMLLHLLFILALQFTDVRVAAIDCIEEHSVYCHATLVLTLMLFMLCCHHVIIATKLIFLLLRILFLVLFCLQVFVLQCTLQVVDSAEL